MTSGSAAGATAARSTVSVPGEGPLRDAVHRMVAPGADAVFFELWLPRTYERVDVVVVADDATHGFELKSGRDTLGRLPRQAVAFSRVMDWCSLVVATRHLRVAATAVPEWWGLTVADEENRLEVIRPGRPNPGPFDRQTLVEMLWKRDVAAELARLGMISGRRTGWDSHTRDRMWVWLLEKVDVDELRACVRRALVLRARERGPLTPSEMGAEADDGDGAGTRRAPRASYQARARALRVLARAEDGAAFESNATSEPAAVGAGGDAPRIHWLCRAWLCKEGLIESVPDRIRWHRLTARGVEYVDQLGLGRDVEPSTGEGPAVGDGSGCRRAEGDAVALVGRLFAPGGAPGSEPTCDLQRCVDCLDERRRSEVP